MSPHRLFAVALAPLLAATAAVAGELPKGQAALPGVESTYSIVTPAPEPDEAPATRSGTTKVGKWELTVSGYVWVQVGSANRASDRPEPSTQD